MEASDFSSYYEFDNCIVCCIFRVLSHSYILLYYFGVLLVKYLSSISFWGGVEKGAAEKEMLRKEMLKKETLREEAGICLLSQLCTGEILVKIFLYFHCYNTV